MVDFKKRALILTLAATVSVTGSFAADNYKNCLMNLEFKPVSSNEISLVLNTKTPYDGNISPMRKDANTFVIMLPEIDNQAPTPDLSSAGNCIQSVEIRKMPYANGAKGYTKILIKTTGVINLNASSAVYLPPSAGDGSPAAEPVQSVEDNAREMRETSRPNAVKRNRDSDSYNNRDNTSSRSRRQEEENTSAREVKQTESATVPTEQNVEETEQADQIEDNTEVDFSDSSNQKYLLGLLVIAILLTSAYLYLRAQDKLTNVLGEKLQIDISDDPEEKKQPQKRRHRISSAINKLDATYRSQSVPFKVNSYSEGNANLENEPEVETNVVDLDTLFKEKQEIDKNKTEQVLSDALDDFLSGFTFDDSEMIENLENSREGNQDGYDEKLYQRVLESANIAFSRDDIICFRNLLQSEVSDDLLRNVETYVKPTVVEKKKPSKDKLIEKFVTEYTISQNITFNEEDVRILRKLISVELDRDFIYDLRTNSKRTERMEKEILSSNPQQKVPPQIVTLKVKELLPNLSDALKKQGNRPIEPEVKPQVVYYKEGYEVDKLSLSTELPDLAKEVKKNKGYISKPSAAYETVDSSYSDSVQKLSISGLPDLKDVMENPEKYEDAPIEEYVPDENELLSRIMNVQFKPFDDGTRKFEIINNIDDDTDEGGEQVSAVDIQKEFSQFTNFEVAQDEDNEKVYEGPEYDDFEALYSQNYIDFDADKLKADEEQSLGQSNISAEKSSEDKAVNNTAASADEQDAEKEPKNEEFIPQNLNRANNYVRRNNNKKSEDLNNMLEKLMTGSEERARNIKTRPIKKTVLKKEITKSKETPAQPIMKCVLDGVSYDVLSSSVIKDDIGCYLAKSDKGYAVIAYSGSELKIIKKYDSLNSEKIFARLNERLDDGTQKYIIKIGLNKFIVDINDNQVRYVMDLC